MSVATDQALAYPLVDDDELVVSPKYFELQARGPVRVQLPYGPACWVATGYEDCRLVHADRRFVKELGVGLTIPRNFPMSPLDPSMLANMDPPRHTRIRKLTTAAFARPRIRGMKEWVASIADELLDAMAAGGGPADFVSAYATQLPNLVVTGILGVPREDVPTFRAFIDDMLDPNGTAATRDAASAKLNDYIRGLVVSRRVQSTNDVLSDLVSARDDDDRLTEDELVMLCQSLFLGGFETTVAQLGSTFYTLLKRRDRYAELVEDRDLVPAALEEMWRWVPTTKYGNPMPRWAAEDVELSHGVVIPQGDIIFGERAVANLDESVYPHALDIDFHRVDPAPHLTLGWGPHHCVGANLAHMEIEITFEKLLERFPDLALAVPAAEVEWSRRRLLRCPEALPITW
jgi:cytochrome P450